MSLEFDLFIRMFLAAIGGAVIGYERSQRMKAAGIRTHLLVAAASALFIIISKYGFNDILGKSDIDLDPSRIAAQVVSGISFIGAGTILVKNQNINGLTTAAGLWITSGVGMAFGAGLYLIGGLATSLIVVIQYFLREEFLYTYIFKREKIKFNIEANYSDQLQQDLFDLLKKHHVNTIAFEILKIDRETITLNVTGKVLSRTYDNNELIEALYKLEDVKLIR